MNDGELVKAGPGSMAGTKQAQNQIVRMTDLTSLISHGIFHLFQNETIPFGFDDGATDAFGVFFQVQSACEKSQVQREMSADLQLPVRVKCRGLLTASLKVHLASPHLPPAASPKYQSLLSVTAHTALLPTKGLSCHQESSLLATEL